MKNHTNACTIENAIETTGQRKICGSTTSASNFARHRKSCSDLTLHVPSKFQPGHESKYIPFPKFEQPMAATNKSRHSEPAEEHPT